ncbi:MAG: Type II secretion system protein E [Planctomycetes bacterium ADurb.Bin412]|nr:MAG: Type II secretion system protein E [Planctomycetes bacterium ADurb.Bin412]
MTEEAKTKQPSPKGNFPFLETIAEDQLAPDLVQKFPLGFLKKHHLIPIMYDHKPAVVLADPLQLEPYDDALNVLQQYCPRLLSSPQEIEQAISRCYYQHQDLESGAAGLPAEGEIQTLQNIYAPGQTEDLLNVANQAPVVKLVNTIFFQAVSHRASDIHIEPYEKEVKIRYRIDGVLHDAMTPPLPYVIPLISRLKIMANLNIAEHRLPQDGQSRIRIGQKEMDIRVSIIPISGGERVVLRLLDKGDHSLGLEQVGFTPKIEKCFKTLIHQPHGILLLTGPTGSGKTTTLYAVINALNSHERNILTVEDPIEYQLPGVGQMQVKPKINLTFAHCLRHILRQDPDVIMIGEIRDRETADIAIQASLTGHLVLSTLHTNNAASAPTRLIDMGIEPYLIASSLNAVMAQRLLRVICPNCRVPCQPEEDVSHLWPSRTSRHLSAQFYQGAGCPRCLQTGYLGRTGIFELLQIDDEIKELITRRTGSHLVEQHAVEKGMITLREDGLYKVLAGITTVEEVLRVTQDHATAEIRIQEHVGS